MKRTPAVQMQMAAPEECYRISMDEIISELESGLASRRLIAEHRQSD